MLAYGVFSSFFGGSLVTAVSRARWQYGDLVVIGAQIAVAAVLSPLAFVMAANRKKVPVFGSTTFTFLMVSVLIVIVGWQFLKMNFKWQKALPFWQLLWPPEGEDSNTYIVRGYFWAFVIFGGGGIFFRLNDGDGKWLCLKKGILDLVQAHALWHVLGGVALLLGFDFFAWSSRSAAWADYNVTGATDPTVYYPNYYGTAALSGVLAVGFLFITLLAPGSLVDNPDVNMPTAWAITIFFALVAITLAVLKLAGVVGEHN